MTETWNPTPESKSQGRGLEVTDIVERLKDEATVLALVFERGSQPARETMREAADEIVRLRALITEWVRANDAGTRDARGEWDSVKARRIGEATDALREEANR